MCNLKNDKIKVMDITYSSSVDGDGFRDVLFVSGCPHHCDGCHNPETWDVASGIEFDQVIDELSWTHISFNKGNNRKQVLKIS